MTKKQRYKLLTFLAGWGFLAIFLWQIDFVLVKENLQKIGWQFVGLLVVTGIAYALATWAWQLCFTKPHPNLSFFKLFIYRQIGETLTTVNPANIIVGESAKLYLLKQADVPLQEGAVSILLSRILILLSMVALFLVLPIGLMENDLMEKHPIKLSLLIIGITVLFIGFFHFMVSKKLYVFRLVQFIEKFSSNYTPLKASDFWTKIRSKTKETNELLAHFYQNQKEKLIVAFLLSLLHWIMGAVEIYLILYLLNVKCSLFFAIVMEVGITFIKSLGAFIPGQIGVEEYGNKLMLEIVGLGAAGLWITVSILRRARQVFWLGFGGLCFFIIYRVNEKHFQLS